MQHRTLGKTIQLISYLVNGFSAVEMLDFGFKVQISRTSQLPVPLILVFAAFIAPH